MRTARGTGKIDFLELIRQDLSGKILKNFSFQIQQGATLAVRISKEETKKDDSGSIVSMKGKIEDIYWETPDGKRVEWVSLLDMLFMLTQDDVKIEEYPNHVIQKFYKVGSDAAFAHWAMPLACSISKYFEDETIPWDRFIRDHGFSFSLNHVEQAVQKAQQYGLAGPIIHIQPQDLPQFLRTD